VVVAIGFQIKVSRHFLQALTTNGLDVFLHEAVVVAPEDVVGADQRLFGAGGDLVGMQVVQAELVDQGFLDFLVHDEVAGGASPYSQAPHAGCCGAASP
jgi:hypothetical protein